VTVVVCQNGMQTGPDELRIRAALSLEPIAPAVLR